MAVTASVSVTLRAFETGSGDKATPRADHLLEYLYDIASGTGSGQADVVWSDTRSAAGAVDNVDLSGALTGLLGGTITQAKVVLIYIKNTHATGVLIIGNHATPAFSGLFGAAAHTIRVQPGGCLLWVAPVGAGTTNLAVTGGANDFLKIDPGADTISYDIIVIGRTA